MQVEVDEDPAEVKKDEEQDVNSEEKKTKTVMEKYWDYELTNDTHPIWLRNSKEVTTEEYNDFYKNTFNQYLEPLASSHFTTEGVVKFKSILYVPSMAPFEKEDFNNPKTKNIRLYVKRVFISDDFDGELFSRYLSFTKGVVDSNDLPVNVSREILQESRIDICNFWIRFEREYGTLQDLDHAVQKKLEVEMKDERDGRRLE